MSKAEALRKPRNLLLPIIPIAIGVVVWSFADSDRASKQLSASPKYATADGRYGIAEDLFDTRKNLEDISVTTNTPRLGINPDGEPVIVFEKALSSSKWEEAHEILEKTTGDLKDQPEIIEVLRKIDMEIASGGSDTNLNDVFFEQRRAIESVIPQVAGLKDSSQAKEREIKEVEVNKKLERSKRLGVVGMITVGLILGMYEILTKREEKKQKQKASPQPKNSW